MADTKKKYAFPLVVICENKNLTQPEMVEIFNAENMAFTENPSMFGNVEIKSGIPNFDYKAILRRLMSGEKFIFGKIEIERLDSKENGLDEECCTETITYKKCFGFGEEVTKPMKPEYIKENEVGIVDVLKDLQYSLVIDANTTISTYIPKGCKVIFVFSE